MGTVDFQLWPLKTAVILDAYEIIGLMFKSF